MEKKKIPKPVAKNPPPVQQVLQKPPQQQINNDNQPKPRKTLSHSLNNRKIKEEEKVESKPKTGFTSKPSDKYTSIKTVDPFANPKQSKSNSGSFAYWNKDVEISKLNYDPILVTCFEGLVEVGHPYNFIAFTAAKEMLEAEEAGEKVNFILGKLVWPLRTALTNKEEKVLDNALSITKLLSDTVGPNLNPHMKNLLVPIVKKINDKKFKDKIYMILRTFEENGGSDVLKIIKQSVPTYTSI